MELSKSRIRELERKERILDALEAGGVDNWEFYGESLAQVRRYYAIEDLIIDTCNNISDVFNDHIDVEVEEYGTNVSVTAEGDEVMDNIIRGLIAKYDEINKEE